MACSSIFRFIIYHRRCCIRGWSVFLEKDSWLAWMPRAVWRADVLEHKWFLCFIFNTPCSTHPFPPITLSPLSVHVFFCLFSFSLSYPLVVNYLFFVCNYLFIFIFNFVNTFSDSHSISFPIFLCFDWLRWCVCCPVQTHFFLFLSRTCWKGHGGKFILDRLPVDVRVFGLCVVRPNEPILEAGSLSNFLLDCMPALSFLSLLLTHSISL